MSADEPEVSWKTIEKDAALVGADGRQLGRIERVVGDESADIFDGLVISPTDDGGNRYVPAERVTRITPASVETDLSAADAASLPPYAEQVSETWRAGDDVRLGARLRSAWRALFGRRR